MKALFKLINKARTSCNNKIQKQQQKKTYNFFKRIKILQGNDINLCLEWPKRSEFYVLCQIQKSQSVNITNKVQKSKIKINKTTIFLGASSYRRKAD